MKLKLDQRRYLRHFRYAWWKYAVVIAAAFFGWSLLFTMTEPKVPENERIDYLAAGPYVPDQYLERLSAEAMEQPFAENLRQITGTCIFLSDSLGLGPQQLILTISNRQVDVCLLRRAEYDALSAQGAFVPLEKAALPDVPEEAFLYSEETERAPAGYYGLSASSLESAGRTLGIKPEDMVLAVARDNGNEKTSLDFVNWLYQREKRVNE